MIRAFCIGAAALTASCSVTVVHGQTYPSKPIRLFTQFGPGTPGETVARVVAGQMTVSMGQPVVVESRSGGGGVLVAATTARAAPDGYTVAALNLTVPVIGAVISKDLPFDPVKDLLPITMLAHLPAVIAAHPGFPPNSMPELIEYAKANPGKVAYGTTGIGSSFHLTIEQVTGLTGAVMQHVPYKTNPVFDAVSGAIAFAFVVAPQGAPLVKAGKVKALGVAGGSRTRLLPDVPTVAESVPGFEPVPEGTVLFGPAGIPPAVLRRLHAEAVAAIGQPEVREKLTAGGYDLETSRSPEELAAQLKSQRALVARIVKASGFKPQ
jgi:tripartite-type tricarboxylate transporter receptor subunit TctC